MSPKYLYMALQAKGIILKIGRKNRNLASMGNIAK